MKTTSLVRALVLTFSLDLALTACGSDSDTGNGPTNEDAATIMVNALCTRYSQCDKTMTAADITGCKKEALAQILAGVPASKQAAANPCSSKELDECSMAISVSTCTDVLDDNAPLPTQCTRCSAK
jgi:hypothetical protein